MWMVAGTFFALIALTFVGLGQVMGRAFDAIPNRVAAYTVDICGSLAGIVTFSVMSYLQVSPVVWFALVLLLTLRFAGPRDPVQIAAAVFALFLSWVGAYGVLQGQAQTAWSPYYKIFYFTEGRSILTNGIGHQHMEDLREGGIAYVLPHLLNRSAGGPPFDDVLVIGAGSGNDVAAALRYGAKRIDAVEIDPRINEIGRALHPNQPYSDPRVTVHLTDGRNFVRRTEAKYDLAVYALVDSLVLHSGYSSLRLENFLFTREAIEDAKRTLKPGGVFVMYNLYRQGWVVGRLVKMAEEIFGTEPIVISLPPRPEVSADQTLPGSFTMILAGTDSARIEALREKFSESGGFWAHSEPLRSEAGSGFRKASPGQGWVRLVPTQVDFRGIGPLPTDDWPQLYLRDREIPWSPIGEGMVTVTVLSLLLLLAFVPPGGMRPNGRMFFLGAGFMLLETKAVVHMALLFGSTWTVNAVVFASILLMIASANLYVLAARPVRLAPYYALLVAALLVNAIIPMSTFLGLPLVARTLASCLVVFVPIFFAGVIFATNFRESRAPHADIGWNVAGIILGGVSEQLSLVLGFSQLLFVAIAYYLLSLVFRPRSA
jgi:SAM-dependent methyltransferase